MVETQQIFHIYPTGWWREFVRSAIYPTMVEARSKSEYISKIIEGTWWSQIKNKSICPNPKKSMVEGSGKICYMPKQGKRHGGAKRMFTKYAQHKGGYVGAKQKSGYAGAKQKNPDPLKTRILWYSLAFISA
jgi:hypothetical protein